MYIIELKLKPMLSLPIWRCLVTRIRSPCNASAPFHKQLFYLLLGKRAANHQLKAGRSFNTPYPVCNAHGKVTEGVLGNAWECQPDDLSEPVWNRKRCPRVLNSATRGHWKSAEGLYIPTHKDKRHPVVQDGGPASYKKITKKCQEVSSISIT